MHTLSNFQPVAKANGSTTSTTGEEFLTGIRRLHGSTTGGLQVKQPGHERPTVAGVIKVDRRSNRVEGPPVGPANKPSSRRRVGPANKPPNRKQAGLANKPSRRKQAGLGDKPSSRRRVGPGNNLRRMPFRALGVASKPKTIVIGAAQAVAVATAVAGHVVENLAAVDPVVAGDLVAVGPKVVEAVDS